MAAGTSLLTDILKVTSMLPFSQGEKSTDFDGVNKMFLPSKGQEYFQENGSSFSQKNS